ncbi:MAG: Ig-like domain-containing protein, partial [Gemmatimonadaceae bacterium]|nr:Ig-like domain-containing protein [Gemmatimonadaceae bacterium]
MRLAVAVAATGALACASAGTPPGGPPDTDAPQVIEFSPESGTVNFTGRAVVVRFDETISDRGTGAAALEALVVISPRDGEPRVSWERNRIAVRPRNGFRPNTAYTVTIAPGITDLRSNRSRESRTVVFSTGPEIPGGAVTGRVFDWPRQQLARNAWVEALRVSDSAVFVAPADSSGAFTVGALGPGDYIVRGYIDQNANRVLDRSEVWDSVRVAVGGAPAGGIELLLAERDTMPARMASIAITDSVTLTIEFDKPLDPAQAFGPALVRIVRADSTPAGVAAVRTRRETDSLRAAADTSARPPLAQPLDSLQALNVPARPAPPTTLIVTLTEPLQPATTYRVTVTGVRTLLLYESTATRLITTPVRDTSGTARPAGTPPDPASPRDTTPRDTTPRDTT